MTANWTRGVGVLENAVHRHIRAQDVVIWRERYFLSGTYFTIREVELSESVHHCTVEVGGLITGFDTRSEALLHILEVSREMRS